ncbi:MAG: glycosyltransferase family 2 protein, partial [Gemmatimonadota bacterium]
MTDPRASAGRLPPPTWEALDDWLGSVRERALASPAGGEAAASDPEVTISMPARNTAPMIGVALRSVLDQSGPSVEVIVVDDGSDDETATVAEGTGDPRVQVIRLERSRGIGAGHNLVTRHARGRFIVHVDSDDVVLPGGIEGAVAPLRARPELVHTYSDFFDLAVDGSIDEASYHEQLGRFDRRYQSGVDVRRELLVHGMVANHLRAYRKSALEEVGGFGETLVHGED